MCRRVLHDHHDAEDAFQATFLVLVRKAGSVMPREMVGNWLYGVARQTALKARATAGARKGRERQVEMPEPAAAEPSRCDELLAALDEELSRLPDKYRAVVVLCELEGKTRKEAARHLGVPEGTVAGWSARARKMLATRLARRGVALSGGAFAVILSRDAAAGVPASVVSKTINAAILWAAGQAATGVIPVKVAALTEGVLKAMFVTKLKKAAAVLLFVAVVGLGAGLMSYGTAAAQQRGDKDGKPKARKDLDAIQGTWYVTAMEEGGKQQPKERFKDVKMRLVVKGDKLSILTTTQDGREVGQKDVALTLDEKASPKRIDASLGGMTVLGIYALEKGQLKMCLDLEGAKRPSGFKTEEKTKQRCYVLKKAAPAK